MKQFRKHRKSEGHRNFRKSCIVTNKHPKFSESTKVNQKTNIITSMVLDGRLFSADAICARTRQCRAAVICARTLQCRAALICKGTCQCRAAVQQRAYPATGNDGPAKPAPTMLQKRPAHAHVGSNMRKRNVASHHPLNLCCVLTKCGRACPCAASRGQRGRQCPPDGCTSPC